MPERAVYLINRHGRLVEVAPPHAKRLLADPTRGYRQAALHEIEQAKRASTEHAEPTEPSAPGVDPYQALDEALQGCTKAQIIAYIQDGLGGEIEGEPDKHRKEDLINGAILAAMR
ncbi:MAG: hypothetical protein AAGI01_15700, partial [Myxococcota bacterium]